MRSKMFLSLLAAAALMLPAAALADHGGGGNSGPGSANSGQGNGGGARLVRYDLRGRLSGFTAAVGATNGSITILVLRVNKGPQTLVGQTLTFAVSAGTKIEPRGALIANGDRGKVRLEGAANLDAAGLQALVPKKIEDEALEDD
jgi:hypothetical protein